MSHDERIFVHALHLGFDVLWELAVYRFNKSCAHGLGMLVLLSVKPKCGYQQEGSYE